MDLIRLNLDFKMIREFFYIENLVFFLVKGMEVGSFVLEEKVSFIGYRVFLIDGTMFG